jgi:glutamyl-tRNA synthetase
LERLPAVDEPALSQLFSDLVQETGQKMVTLAQPVRVALTGKTASPGLYEIISILGRDETLRRLHKAMEIAKQGGAFG